MPKALVVYYSRTGNTKKVAEALAGLLGADIAAIRCERYRSGVFRYFRAAYDSLKGNLPSIELPPSVHRAYDLIVIGTPIWTGHPALPVRAFLDRNDAWPGKVALFLTRVGSPPEQAFAELEAQLPVPPVAKLALKSKDIRTGRIDEALRAFAAQLEPEQAGQH